MAVLVRIPTPLRALTKGAAEVHADASTRHQHRPKGAGLAGATDRGECRGRRRGGYRKDPGTAGLWLRL